MILVLSEIFPPRHGGSGRWFYELYKRLEPGLATLFTHTINSESEREVDSKFPQRIIRNKYASPEWGIKSIKGLAFYAKSFLAARKHITPAIEQIHCGRCLHEGVLGALLAKLTKRKLIVYVHGEDIETAKSSRELTLLAQWVINTADGLITNSNNTKSILETSWNTSKTRIETIHPGVDIERFTPALDDADFKESKGWNGKYNIITVGRLQRRKGQDKMIEAIPQIKNFIPNILYTIVGDGADVDYLKDLTKQFAVEDCVKFMPSADDETLIKLYQQCDLFILPNRTEGNDIEGFGMVLVEAQACGKPVIAGKSGGTGEALIQGKTGLRADCTDSKAITEVVSKIHQDSKGFNALQCREFAESLSWNEHLKKASSLFKSL